MNILFVTKELQDVELIGRELTRLMPDLHLEVSQDAGQAIEAATVAGRFTAVLIDTALPDGDPLAFVRTLRAQGAPIAIIGVAGPADLDSVARVMGAGADDYVLKRPGFVGTLPAILRRARVRYDISDETGNSSRLLYGSRAAERTGVLATTAAQPKAVSNYRDSAGATSFLLRNLPDVEPAGATAPRDHQRSSASKDDRDVLLRALRASNASRRKLKAELATAREQWEAERAASAERLNASEEERRRSAAEMRGERQQWDRWRTALKQRLAGVEESRSSLEQLLILESDRQAQLAAQYSENARDVETLRRELHEERLRAKQELSELHASLHAAEAQVQQQARHYAAEQNQSNAMRHELEAKIVELEEARAGLEAHYADALAKEEISREEIRQTVTTLTHDLRVATEERERERSRWNTSKEELEQKTRVLEQELGAAKRQLASVHVLAREAAELYQTFLEKLRSLENIK